MKEKIHRGNIFHFDEFSDSSRGCFGGKHLKQVFDQYDPGQELAHRVYFFQHPRVICQIRLGLTQYFMDAYFKNNNL